MRIAQYDLPTRLLRTRKLTACAVLFLAGCILACAFHVSPMILLCAAFVLITAAAACSFKQKRIAAALLLLALLPVGAARYESAWRALEPIAEQSAVNLNGRIASVPEYRAETERTVCILDDTRIDGEAMDAKLRLYLRGEPELLQRVEFGQRIECQANIWQGDPATNPGQFDFGQYLRINGLAGYATAEIEEAQLSPPVYTIFDLPERFRISAGELIDRLFPKSAPIVRAFLIADKTQLSEEERSGYANAGAAHLLALSGMHISLIAFLLEWLLNRFLRRRHAFLITLGFLAVYGWLIGLSPAYSRALIMFALSGFARIVGRRADPINSLSIAMLAALIIRPTDLLSASFVLSYAATAGIILLSPPLTDLLHLEPLLRVPKWGDMRMRVMGHAHRWLAQSLIASLAAQIATLPAVVHFFGAQPVFSILVNLIALPIAIAGYILSILGTLTRIAPVCLLSDSMFSLLTQIVCKVGASSTALLRIARFPIWLVLLCAAVCLCASGLSRIPKRIRSFLPLFVLLAAFISNLAAGLTTRGVSIMFLDAGEADCAVVRAEGTVALVDAGDAYSPAGDVLSALNYTPDIVFLSHPHADHVNGLDGILDTCTPKRICIAPGWELLEPHETVTAALNRAIDLGSEVTYITAGDVIPLSEKTSMHVLAPDAGIPAGTANENSLVLQLVYGDTSALFCADVPAEQLEGYLPDADILKVPHHGAKDALSAVMLEEVSPSVCIIPVGDNSHGHPTQKTLDLLDASGAQVFRTDKCGAVTCTLSDDGSVAIRTYFQGDLHELD